MKSIAIASVFLVLSSAAALAQRGDTIAMRDGSTIIRVGNNCLVQYGARGERINNATRCTGGDLRSADRVLSGANRLGPDPDQDLPGGSWVETCRGGVMRGAVLHAQCRTEDGRRNPTSLDMRRCSAGDAENHNGILVCD